MPTLTHSTTLASLICGACGIPFAMPEAMLTKVQQDGTLFWCPNGHNVRYFESENAKLKKLVEEKQAEANRQRENYFAEQRKHEETQRKMTRLQKRTAAGVCPCCKRTFSQLARHMHTKHEDFVKQHGIPVAERTK